MSDVPFQSVISVTCGTVCLVCMLLPTFVFRSPAVYLFNWGGGGGEYLFWGGRCVWLYV
jgi:hypothetical protein